MRDVSASSPGSTLDDDASWTPSPAGAVDGDNDDDEGGGDDDDDEGDETPSLVKLLFIFSTSSFSWSKHWLRNSWAS